MCCLSPVPYFAAAVQVRELKTSNSLVLLETNMAAGHFANSGLEGRLKERAFKWVPGPPACQLVSQLLRLSRRVTQAWPCADACACGRRFAFLLQTVAPCATMANQHTELGARCRGCFAALVAAATTIALVCCCVCAAWLCQ